MLNQFEFADISVRHAGIDQVRKNYVPYLREETKLLMKERNVLKEEATKHSDPILLAEYKITANLYGTIN